jgi:hypothetical protein
LSVFCRMLSYTTFVTPLRIAFVEKESLTWFIIDVAIDVLFFFDIIINFFSAYFDQNFKIVTDKKLIAKNYLTGWFLIDFISIFPISIILESSKDYLSLARLARLPRLYKVIKITK